MSTSTCKYRTSPDCPSKLHGNVHCMVPPCFCEKHKISQHSPTQTHLHFRSRIPPWIRDKDMICALQIQSFAARLQADQNDINATFQVSEGLQRAVPSAETGVRSVYFISSWDGFNRPKVKKRHSCSLPSLWQLSKGVPPSEPSFSVSIATHKEPVIEPYFHLSHPWRRVPSCLVCKGVAQEAIFVSESLSALSLPLSLYCSFSLSLLLFLSPNLPPFTALSLLMSACLCARKHAHSRACVDASMQSIERCKALFAWAKHARRKHEKNACSKAEETHAARVMSPVTLTQAIPANFSRCDIRSSIRVNCEKMMPLLPAKAKLFHNSAPANTGKDEMTEVK